MEEIKIMLSCKHCTQKGELDHREILIHQMLTFIRDFEKIGCPPIFMEGQISLALCIQRFLLPSDEGCPQLTSLYTENYNKQPTHEELIKRNDFLRFILKY